jgi:putative ABC transport system permease protein
MSALSQTRTRNTTRGVRRFFWTYLLRTLVGHLRQTAITAIGLAVGVAAVVTLTAASEGVSRAQSAVLHALYGVSTDISVTSPSSRSSSSASGAGIVSAEEGPQDRLSVPPGLGVLDPALETAIAKVHGVAEVGGGLRINETKFGVAASPGALPPVTTTAIEGIDARHLKLGPYASASLASGRSFTGEDSDSHVAVIDAAYAAAENLHVGSNIDIAGVSFTVIGIVRQPAVTNGVEVYIPLDQAWLLASAAKQDSLVGKVDAIYVSVKSAADVTGVQARIAGLIPTATVTSSSDMATRVSGSLASAAKLATDLGRIVAFGLLVAAFGLSCLLTIGAVRRRVREFGTLKALGWRTMRIVTQLMAESLVTGAVGAVAGIGLGVLGAALINAIAPPLTATIALNPGSTPPQGALINNGTLKTLTLPGAVQTVDVHLQASIGAETVLLAIGLAVVGAVLAGALGSWRAARLRPTEALSHIT